MMLAESILIILLAAPTSARDKLVPATERSLALEGVANAIASASRTPEDAAMLLALERYESDGSLDVIRGNCLPLGHAACDHGKALGPWQLHAAACPRAWALAHDSLDSLNEQARCANSLLHWNARRGKAHTLIPIEAAFCGYGARPWHCRLGEVRAAAEKKIRVELGRLSKLESFTAVR